MSDSKSSPRGCSGKKGARNLPSWMSSSDNSKSRRNETADVGACTESGGSEKPKEARGKGKGDLRGTLSKENKTGKESAVSSTLDTTNFSKLLDGVVFVLSGFVNPDRSTLRSQALEMGAEYQPDWNSDCTLLVCAFQNTPKFRQVEADCGTIVSKDWITECYNQKKLVDIENYLMHAGKPWRKASNVLPDPRSHGKPKKPVEQLGAKTKASTSSKCKAPTAENYFSPSKLKKWAVDDWQRTIEWLDSQKEKPEPSEIKKVAAEGILTCLQDAIDILEQKQEIDCIIEEWNFVPRVVEELAKLETMNSSTKEDLFKRAVTCKRFYEIELSGLDSCSEMKKKLKTDPATYDSDDTDKTIEMTEEEIEVAYNAVAYKFCR